MAYSRLFQTFFSAYWTDQDDASDGKRKNKKLQRLAIMFPFRWWDSKEFWEDHLYFTYNDLKTKPTECLNQCLRLVARATKKNLPHYFAVQLRLIFKCFILNMDEEFDGIDYGSR